MGKSKTKSQKKWLELLTLLLTAFIFAVIVGNIIIIFGDSYIVPGINLDLLTFVTVFGYGLCTVLIVLVIDQIRR
jgi:hypothetical protein